MIHLHCDVDNVRLYEREHGVAESFDPHRIYDQALPILLDLIEQAGARATFFVVGQDAALKSCREFCLLARSRGSPAARTRPGASSSCRSRPSRSSGSRFTPRSSSFSAWATFAWPQPCSVDSNVTRSFFSTPSTPSTIRRTVSSRARCPPSG